MFGLWAITLHWGSAAAKLVEYDWNVTYTNIDIDGRTFKLFYFCDIIFVQ